MAIELLTGVPGGGKSYFAVHKIHKLLEKDGKFLVLHNIEGLKIPDYRLISKDWTLHDFENDTMAAYLGALRQEYGMSLENKIYIFVDEAQRFFPPELKDPKVLFFFDYHRHLGVEITLITQHEKKISYKITTLAEIEIRAANTRINPFGSFLYKHVSGGEQFSTSRLKRDPKIFALYKSFQAGDGKAKKSNFRWLVLAFFLTVPLFMYYFFNSFTESFGVQKKNSASEVRPPDTRPADSRPADSRPADSRPESRSSIFTGDPLVRNSPGQNAPNQVELEQKPTYQGPQIKSYSESRDALSIVVTESGVEAYTKVSDFVKKYPPDLYGYGYIHKPGKAFYMTTADCSSYIYPVNNPILVRNYIKNESPAPVESAPLYLPLDIEHKTEYPDLYGYRKSDYEYIYYRQRNLPLPVKETPVVASVNASSPISQPVTP